jgi:hypothetical protein
VRESRAGTIYTKTEFTNDLSLELGGIISSTEKIGDEYDRVEGDQVFLDEIDSSDTLAHWLMLPVIMRDWLPKAVTRSLNSARACPTRIWVTRRNSKPAS